MNKKPKIVHTTTFIEAGKWSLESWEVGGSTKTLHRYIGTYASNQEALFAAMLIETRHLVEPNIDRRGAIEHTKSMS